MGKLDLRNIDLGAGMVGVMLPECVINLNVEIILHHPECVKLMQESLKESNFDPLSYLSLVAAYCNILVDGEYDSEELVDTLMKALVAKREGINLILERSIEVPNIANFLNASEIKGVGIQQLNTLKEGEDEDGGKDDDNSEEPITEQ
jgi:hypothetical protein